MAFEGRSPIRDVIRSVVLGATMVSPAALEACGKDPPPRLPPTALPDPTTPNTDPTVEPSATAMPTATTEPTDDPDTMTGPSQRPRGDAGFSIPTRGFAGAVRGS